MNVQDSRLLAVLLGACLTGACGSPSAEHVASTPEQRPTRTLAFETNAYASAAAAASASAPAPAPASASASASASAPASAPAPAPAPASASVSSSGSACALRPVCGAPTPPFKQGSFVHNRNAIFSRLSTARHRGRDLFLLPGSPQWVLAKFAYGPEDKDIEDENVEIYVLRDCGTSWESAGTFRTTTEGSHAEVLGVADGGGQIYVDLAKVLPGGPLGIGRHRVHLVVPGDGSVVDLYLEVLAPGARIAVSDIDGTLTESENAVVWDVLTDDKAAANPGAADVMKELSGRGFYMFYLTARPHWLEPTTRKWLTMRGFPPGIVHTSVTATGRTGPEAAAFKSGELSLLKQATGLVPALGFGNMPSDVIAYSNAGLSKPGTFFFKLAENANGAVVHDDYRTLVPKLSVLPKSCP